VRENVNVVLASTKAGQPVSTVYDVAKIKEEYSVTPEQLIDIKAIQGDSSDNIPGVAGIGPKGAIDLISTFHSIESIYENLEALDIKAGTKAKLEASRESAFLSKTLGTICLEAPISTDLSDYRIKPADKETALKRYLDLFSGRSGIVYCSSRKKVEELYNEISGLRRIKRFGEGDEKLIIMEEIAQKIESGKQCVLKHCKTGGVAYLLAKEIDVQEYSRIASLLFELLFTFENGKAYTLLKKDDGIQECIVRAEDGDLSFYGLKHKIVKKL
jgi:5'-3' exonuclease